MYTVVVADDEEELRGALIRRLNWAEAGFQVVGEAENGVEALELVERLEPDLLLTDIRMPFMSGIDLAREAQEIRPALQIAFLSGYDDFSYAQEAIRYNVISYILKPVSAADMAEELKKIKKKLDAKFEEFSGWTMRQGSSGVTAFLMPLLLDSFQREADQERERTLAQAAASCGFPGCPIQDCRYVVVITSLWDSGGENRTTPGSVNAIDSILSQYVSAASFYTDGRVASLLAAPQAELDQYLHILVEDITQSVRRITGLRASIGVSRETDRLSGCHEAYLEAMNALNYCRGNESGVQFISDIERAEHFDHEEIQSIINTVENLLKSGTSGDLSDYLQRLRGRIRSQAIAPPAARFMMMQLTAAIFRLIYTVADKDTVQSLQNLFPMQQFFFEEPARLWDRYVRFCMAARELISKQRSMSGSAICDQALGIIRDRYSDPELSLTSISSQISVSPNYLSALIKKSTGRTFVELLTGRRIETAKNLLEESSLKVRDIALQCGYNDQHYFSYCFRKEVGLSPNGYRKQKEKKP